MTALAGDTPSAGAGVGGEPATFNSSPNSDGKVFGEGSAIVKTVKDFVSAFNTLDGKLRELKTGGANSATISRIQEQVGNAVGGADADALAAIGIARSDKLLHMPQVPAAIPVRPNTFYFSLSAKNPLYQKALEEGTLAVYAPDGMPGLKIELIAVM